MMCCAAVGVQERYRLLPLALGLALASVLAGVGFSARVGGVMPSELAPGLKHRPPVGPLVWAYVVVNLQDGDGQPFKMAYVRCTRLDPDPRREAQPSAFTCRGKNGCSGKRGAPIREGDITVRVSPPGTWRVEVVPVYQYPFRSEAVDVTVKENETVTVTLKVVEVPRIRFKVAVVTQEGAPADKVRVHIAGDVLYDVVRGPKNALGSFTGADGKIVALLRPNRDVTITLRRNWREHSGRFRSETVKVHITDEPEQEFRAVIERRRLDAVLGEWTLEENGKPIDMKLGTDKARASARARRVKPPLRSHEYSSLALILDGAMKFFDLIPGGYELLGLELRVEDVEGIICCAPRKPRRFVIPEGQEKPIQLAPITFVLWTGNWRHDSNDQKPGSLDIRLVGPEWGIGPKDDVQVAAQRLNVARQPMGEKIVATADPRQWNRFKLSGMHPGQYWIEVQCNGRLVKKQYNWVESGYSCWFFRYKR